MLSIGNDTSNAKKLEIAISYMKNHDSNKRIQGIRLYDEVILSEYRLLSLKSIQQLQIIFECENNNDVLIRLSKLCMRIGIISLFKENVHKFNINECDSFDDDFVGTIKECNELFFNSAWEESGLNFVQDSYNNCAFLPDDFKYTVDVIVSLVPILQDIAEVDDIVVRTETLKSLKSLLNLIKFIIEELIKKDYQLSKNELEKKLTFIFNQSIGIFENLASSDILSHKILSCYVIPLVFEQKRLCDYFSDERNILLTNYSDFCTHPAPILRKHACKVFNSIMEEIEFNDDIINMLLLPIIRNFCFDEQECVRSLAIENIESFLLQIELFQMSGDYTQSIFMYFDKLQPLILRLCNDLNWRIRSTISKSVINIYIRLIYLESITNNENIGMNDMLEENNLSITGNKKEYTADSSYQKEIENIEIICNSNDITEDSSFKNLECNLDHSSVKSNYGHHEFDFGKHPDTHMQKLTLILNQLLSDSEGETRNSTLSNILDFIEENVNYKSCEKVDLKAQKAKISKILFYNLIVPQVSDLDSSLISDSYKPIRINLSRVLTIIMIIKEKSNDNSDENLMKSDELFKKLIEKLVRDHDTQVRQSVILALCSGVVELKDNQFIIENVIPYSELLIQDNFWRVRYCSILLFTLIFYRVLESYYSEEDIWSGNLNEKYTNSCLEDFFNANQKAPNILLSFMLGYISDKTSIIRQLTCIFVLPLLSYWFGHNWTREKLWTKLIMPLILNESSYSLRSIGLLSASSIIMSINVRSFKELRHAVKLILQLIFTVIPFIDPKDNYDCEDRGVRPGEPLNANFDQCRSENVNPNLDLNTGKDLGSNKDLDLSFDIEALSCYLPLLTVSNLILSYKPFELNEFKDLEVRSKKNFEATEFHSEIVSTVIQYSIRDSVPNVRIKAFQVIHSFLKVNGIKSCHRSIIDQIRYSYENDPDLEIRNYCMNILKNKVSSEIQLLTD